MCERISNCTLGCRLTANPTNFRRRISVVAAGTSAAGEAQIASENVEGNGDGNDGLDERKMTRVCDKLIGIFMVDKPSPTDWRRLLAFSKEWDNIRPHFYERCVERASTENDPEMKHKLLKLGRKLKEVSLRSVRSFVDAVSCLLSSCFDLIDRSILFQVDEDVQRQNELLNLLKERQQDEIGELVARRRKDFTKEFFVHLHTVAESLYDDPTQQNSKRH